MSGRLLIVLFFLLGILMQTDPHWGVWGSEWSDQQVFQAGFLICFESIMAAIVFDTLGGKS